MSVYAQNRENTFLEEHPRFPSMYRPYSIRPKISTPGFARKSRHENQGVVFSVLWAEFLVYPRNGSDARPRPHSSPISSGRVNIQGGHVLERRFFQKTKAGIPWIGGISLGRQFLARRVFRRNGWPYEPGYHEKLHQKSKNREIHDKPRPLGRGDWHKISDLIIYFINYGLNRFIFG